MLRVGERAPVEAVVWTTPRESATVGELCDGHPLLLLFYLFDWSATWTTEVELLRDRSEEFAAAGVQPYAISRDSPYTHIAWMQALDLDFPLLSDWNGDATRGFDVAFEHRGMRDVSRRSAFLLDGEGVVRGAWEYANDELPDLDDLLAASAAL